MSCFNFRSKSKASKETTPSSTTSKLPLEQEKPTPANMSAKAFIDAVKARRTFYALNKNLGKVTPSQIQDIVKDAVRHGPTSFNSQTSRAVVLMGSDHEKHWDIVSDFLKSVMPADRFTEQIAPRMAGFRGAAGSVLFFDDEDTINDVKAKFPIIADKIAGFSNQSVAMQEYIVWTALELEGLGANLQHYTPVSELVTKEWGLPSSWKLDAQLVFGGRAGEAGDKTFMPIEDRVKFAGP